MALIAGIRAPPGRIMGHAGALVSAGEKNALSKVRALEDAGVVITNHPSKFGDGMKQLLGSSSPGAPSVSDKCYDINQRLNLTYFSSPKSRQFSHKYAAFTLFKGLQYARGHSYETSSDGAFKYRKLVAPKCFRT